MSKWFFFWPLLFIGVAQAAQIEMKASQFLKDEVGEALSLLPTEFLSSVSKKITLEEKSFPTDQYLADDLCHLDSRVKFGFTKNNKITISSKLVELARTNNTSFDCSHGSFRKMLTAVLIHELTHVKDNVEKISLDPDFQRIVGMKRVQRSSKKKLLNQNTETSPDSYEFTNLEESLAVNVEYFLLDDEFECRRPATASFLARKLGIPLRGNCTKNTKVLLQSAYMEDSYLLPSDIDPKRVYQIHYLFAGQGRALMSRFGHAMFRLVVCAPFRKKVGPECMDDVSHHLALTYRAYMSDINISYAKGMFGKYPSQLFIMRYLEVQQEYTKFDLRDLYSIPLKMTLDQKRDFLDLTLERFWTYQGKYYFLDNNCGTESKKHLAVALSEEQSDLIHSITPQKIYKDIVKVENDLAEGNIKGLSRLEMIEKRYLVSSMFEELNQSYQYLRPYLPSFKDNSFQNFLKKTTATKRLADYESLAQSHFKDTENLEVKKQLLVKLTYLERYLSNRYLMDIPKKAIQKMNKDKTLKAEVMKMGESLKNLNIQPWEIVNSNYGIPTGDEFNIQFPEFLQKRKSEIKDSLEFQMENLQTILGKKYFEKELLEIEELKRIKALTGQLILNINTVN